ncbi:MAG: HalX domain-containing protein [Haloarculaceae archaeon]
MTTPRTTVLVVEDERQLADLFETWLATDYDVRVAYTGEEALDLADETVDVVLLDRRLPGLSGDEVLDRFHGRGLDCRVVMVTAVRPDFDLLSLGFDDYLTKPLGRDDLVDAVERMLRRDQYDESVDEFARLVSLRATLESEKTRRELETNADYQNLCDRIEALRADLDEVVDSFDEADFEAALRDIE